MGLLFILGAWGDTYFNFIRRVGPQLTGVYQGDNLSAWTTAGFMTVDWPYFAHRVTFDTMKNPAGDDLFSHVASRLPSSGTGPERVALGLTMVVVVGVVALLAVAAVLVRRSGNSGLRRTAFLLAITALTLWLAPMAGGGWANHHFVFAQVALLGFVLHTAVTAQIDQPRLMGVLSSLAVFSIAAVWLTPKEPNSSPEIPHAVNAAIDLAPDNSILNCATWGCYFTYSLVVDGEMPVVWAEGAEMTARLEEDAMRAGSEIVHLCTGCDLEGVRSLYGKSVVEQVEVGTETWLVFLVRPRIDGA